MAEYEIPVPGLDRVPLTVSETGSGPAYLLLHGGAGPQSVLGFADRLAAALPVRVLTPMHPGFDGTPRPAALSTIRDLARVYASLLDELELTEVRVIGNSIGGWIAAELAALGGDRIGGVVLVGAVGLEVPGSPLVDFFALPLSEIADYSYHNPDAFRIDPAALTPEQQAAMAANRATLAAYAETGMTDPALAERLSGIKAPVLVLCGESDRIAPPAYARAFAAAIPGAEYRLLPGTGHLPQLETPDLLLAALAAGR